MDLTCCQWQFAPADIAIQFYQTRVEILYKNECSKCPFAHATTQIKLKSQFDD